MESEKTLRDEFAMAALTGILMCGDADLEQAALEAYGAADYALKIREKYPLVTDDTGDDE